MTFPKQLLSKKNLLFGIISCLLLIYLYQPDLTYPNPPPDAIQSKEPADTEDINRKAYFTNFTRQEVLNHYQNQFRLNIFSTVIPSYRLNYPPEESRTIIRDQTRSTFLEEIIYPMRESIFVNGFEPKDPKDTIFIDGKVWRQKIIIRYVPSNRNYRMLIGFSALLGLFFMLTVWGGSVKVLFRNLKRLI